jgi:hypothetical protein
MNWDRGSLATPPLPHHRTYGSVSGGSVDYMWCTGLRREPSRVNLRANLRRRLAVQWRVRGCLRGAMGHAGCRQSLPPDPGRRRGVAALQNECVHASIVSKRWRATAAWSHPPRARKADGVWQKRPAPARGRAQACQSLPRARNAARATGRARSHGAGAMSDATEPPGRPTPPSEAVLFCCHGHAIIALRKPPQLFATDWIGEAIGQRPARLSAGVPAPRV